VNPLLLPLIEKEIRKIFDAKIIVPLIFSKWLSNLVPARKKKLEKKGYVWIFETLIKFLSKIITLYRRWIIFYRG